MSAKFKSCGVNDKISPEKMARILKVAAGGESYTVIAARFGMSCSTIGTAIRRYQRRQQEADEAQRAE